MTWMRTPRRARSIATTSASVALVYATSTRSMSCSATRRGSSASSPSVAGAPAGSSRGSSSRKPTTSKAHSRWRRESSHTWRAVEPVPKTSVLAGWRRSAMATSVRAATQAEVKLREVTTSRPASRVPSKPPETSAAMTAADQPRSTRWPEVRRRAPGKRVTGSYARAAPSSRIVRKPVNSKPAFACQDIRAATGPAPPSRMSDRKPKVAKTSNETSAARTLSVTRWSDHRSVVAPSATGAVRSMAMGFTPLLRRTLQGRLGRGIVRHRTSRRFRGNATRER